MIRDALIAGCPGVEVHCDWWCLVPPMGFEPTISALRGRCPRPLDDGGLCLDDTGHSHCNAGLQVQGELQQADKLP